MSEGNSTFLGLGVPLNGEFELTQKTAATDIVTITGAGSQSGDFLVCQSSTGTEALVVDVSGNVGMAGKVNKMVITTVALASLASDASATVSLTGITTNCVVAIFPRAATTTANMPAVWASDAGKLGYGAGGTATTTATVNVWFFDTA